MIDCAILTLRLCLGFVFIAHGLQAAFGIFGGPGVNAFSVVLSGLGFKPALFWAYLAAYTELIGGICLALGVSVRIAAVSLFIFISVAAFKAHLSKGFFIQNGGFEYNFVIACICIALMMLGSGKFRVKI